MIYNYKQPCKNLDSQEYKKQLSSRVLKYKDDCQNSYLKTFTELVSSVEACNHQSTWPWYNPLSSLFPEITYLETLLSCGLWVMHLAL